jgi:rhodanese-related sulfurtransferase
MITTITPRDLADRHEKEAVNLIDVRTPAEFGEIHVTFARCLPLDQLDAKLIKEDRAKSDRPLYVICRSGSRGQMACEKLIAAGVSNVVHVEGGTLAWEQAGLPVARGKKAMSLERQVRIAAGSLVLLGVALGAFVSQWLYGLSAFVGAGLVFAGLTDTCGMGMLLARMPWNRRGATCST